MSFPKLKYPILTQGMSTEHRLIVLSYDMMWRLREAVQNNHEAQKFSKGQFDPVLSVNEKLDLDANLTNLGSYVEQVICNGDFTLMYENIVV